MIFHSYVSLPEGIWTPCLLLEKITDLFAGHRGAGHRAHHTGKGD